MRYLSSLTKNHGENVSVICDAGFHLSDPNHGSCTCLDGKCVPSLPKCVANETCPFPEKIMNGFVSSTGFYVCRKGYVLSGMKQRKCVNKTWEGSAPKCLQRVCPKFPTIKHGQFLTFPWNKRFAYLSCDQNYLPSSSFVKNASRFSSFLFCVDEVGKEIFQHVKQKQD